MKAYQTKIKRKLKAPQIILGAYQTICCPLLNKNQYHYYARTRQQWSGLSIFLSGKTKIKNKKLSVCTTKTLPHYLRLLWRSS